MAIFKAPDKELHHSFANFDDKCFINLPYSLGNGRGHGGSIAV